MDLNRLSKVEVDLLIDRLKNPMNLLSYGEINVKLSAMFNSINITEAVIDDGDVEYFLHVYRGKYDMTRFSFHLRFKDNHEHLVRVDINPTGKHVNPDGSVITDSHMHIYNPESSKKDSFAIPLNPKEFPNIETIIEAYMSFEQYINLE